MGDATAADALLNHRQSAKGRAFRIVADVWNVLTASQNPSAGLPDVVEVEAKMKTMAEAAEIF